MAGQERAERLKEMEASQQSSTIVITAQLNHHDYNSVIDGELAVEVPSGVAMLNRAGSRSLEFVCSDEKAAEELVAGLEASGMPWDEDFTAEEIII